MFPFFLRARASASAASLAVLTAFAAPALPAQTSVIAPDPMVVATAKATNPLVVPQPVPAHDGADVLKTTPGFNAILKGSTDGDPVLRGMAGSRLGILVEGEGVLGGRSMRIDPPSAYIFPTAYDRITVTKGPQSVLYGPVSPADAVRFERDFERRDGAMELRDGEASDACLKCDHRY